MAEQKIDEWLAHHGIKGMKWGVRRSEGQLAKAQDAVRRANEYDPDKLYVSGKGRRTRVSSGESARAATLAGVVKKHGPGTLSNKDLEFLNKRLQLTATNTKLSPKQKTKIQHVISVVAAAKRLDDKLGNPVTNAAIAGVNKKTGGKYSEILQVLDKTAKQTRPKKQKKEESVVKTDDEKKSVIETVTAKPRQIYNLETKEWETR